MTDKPTSTPPEEIYINKFPTEDWSDATWNPERDLDDSVKYIREDVVQQQIETLMNELASEKAITELTQSSQDTGVYEETLEIEIDKPSTFEATEYKGGVEYLPFKIDLLKTDVNLLEYARISIYKPGEEPKHYAGLKEMVAGEKLEKFDAVVREEDGTVYKSVGKISDNIIILGNTGSKE